MSKKPINFKAPNELVALLENNRENSTRSLFSIKLLRSFFKENPPLVDMSGVLGQECTTFTLRVPQDLVELIEEFAHELAYDRHTAMVVILMSMLSDRPKLYTRSMAA